MMPGGLPAMWFILAVLQGAPTPFTMYGFTDKEACELLRKQIVEQLKPQQAECLYLAFHKEDAKIKDHIPPAPQQPPKGHSDDDN